LGKGKADKARDVNREPVRGNSLAIG